MVNYIDDFKNDGYYFIFLSQMVITLITDIRNRTYEFYMKHNKCNLEWLLNKKLNANPNPIRNFNMDGRHPMIKEYKRVRLLNRINQSKS